MPDYVPKGDSDAIAWMNTYVAFATANTAPLGMVAADLTALNTPLTAFNTVFQAHNTAQQQAKGACAAKDAARVTAVAAFRNSVRVIQARPATTDAQREGLGITVRDRDPGLLRTALAVMSRPKLTVDTSQRLQHLLRLSDAQLANARKRPVGAIECEILSCMADLAAESKANWQLVATARKRMHLVTYDAAMAGKAMQYQARWVYKDGAKGPWSEVVSATIVG